MIRRSVECRVFSRGPGVEIKVLTEPAEIYEAGRLYAQVTFAPGANIDFHIHEMEMESFYVIRGKIKVDDNGESTYLNVGDTLITPAGQGHALHNDGDEPVEMIASIISCKQNVPGKSVAKD